MMMKQCEKAIIPITFKGFDDDSSTVRRNVKGLRSLGFLTLNFELKN
jgi:hypothetical protein